MAATRTTVPRTIASPPKLKPEPPDAPTTLMPVVAGLSGVGVASGVGVGVGVGVGGTASVVVSPTSRPKASYSATSVIVPTVPGQRNDADAMRELAQVPLGLPPGLELEWLGTAGYRLTYEGQTIFIDPYVSRVPLKAVFRRRAALADERLHERYLVPHAGDVLGILVGHTHFDHAI